MSELKSNNIRQSGIELLKIVAILLICLSHCTQTLERFMDFQAYTTDFQLIFLRLLKFNGQIGNIIFIICSSWFLANSKKSKANKAINLALDSQLISVGIFAVYVACSIFSSFHIGFSNYLENIFPDWFAQVWFVPTYIIFYLIHPYLNNIIQSISQQEHFFICIFSFVVYGIGGLIGAKPAFSDLLGFVMIYFLVVYLKKYKKDKCDNVKKNAIIYFSLLLLFIVAVIAKNFLALKWPIFGSYPKIDNYNLSIFLLPMMINFFYLFLKLDFKSKIINYLSSCSLFVYCIHENYYVRELLRPKFYQIMMDRFGSDKYLIYLLILFVIVVISAFAAAAFYKSFIHKYTAKLSLKIEALIKEKINNYIKRQA